MRTTDGIEIGCGIFALVLLLAVCIAPFMDDPPKKPDKPKPVEVKQPENKEPLSERVGEGTGKAVRRFGRGFVEGWKDGKN